MIHSLDADRSIRGGVRNILDHPELEQIVRSEPIRCLVGQFLSAGAVCVRGILFDKTQENNWNLPFHQDTKIAVKAEHQVPGFNQFSEKEGVTHVCPPVDFLQRQIALRIHLDNCNSDAGPVKVVEGSDRLGLLSQSQIASLVESSTKTSCEGGVGSVLVFRSLLLHGSDRSTSTKRRRVLHLEFCDAELPHPLEWKWAISIA